MSSTKDQARGEREMGHLPALPLRRLADLLNPGAPAGHPRRRSRARQDSDLTHVLLRSSREATDVGERFMSLEKPFISRAARPFLGVAALLAALAWPSSARAEPTAADKAMADALFREAKALAEQNRFGEACPKIAEAQRLDPAPGAGLVLGDCYERIGKLASAWGAFNETIAIARNAGDERRRVEAARRAGLLEGRLPKVAIVVPPPVRVPGLEIRWDGKAIGEAAWSTAIPADPGTHTLEAGAPGRMPWSTQVNVPASGAIDVTVPFLPSAPSTTRRAFSVSVKGGFVATPSFGGDLSKSCSGSCSASLGMGGLTALYLSYELPSGVDLGITGGYLSASTRITSRESSLFPVGKPPNAGTVDDRLLLQGGMVGVTAGFRLGGRFPVLFRLGAGALIGSLRDERSGIFQSSSGVSYSVKPLTGIAPARFFYLSPEVRAGVTFGGRFELSAGFEALLLIAATRPVWDDTVSIVGADGLANWSAETFTGKVIVLLVPSLEFRAGF